MDPVTASLTIAGAAGTAAMFAKQLYRAYDEARMFDEDIEAIATTFASFGDTVAVAKYSFMSVCEEHPNLTVLSWISERGLLQNLVNMSIQIDGRIRIFSSRFRRVARKTGLLGIGSKVWWTYRHKEDIEKLQPRMIILTNCLSSVYDALQLNILMTMAITPQLKKKIRRLKRILKQKEKTIKNLRRHQTVEQTTVISEDTDGPQSEFEVLDTTDMLLELGQSLRRSETVEDIEPQLNQTAERTKPRRRRSDQDGYRVVLPGVVFDTQPPPPQLRRTRAHIPEQRRQRPEPRVVIPESALRRFERNAAEEQARDVPEGHRDSMASAHSTLLTRQTSSSSTNRTTPESPATPTTPAAVPTRQNQTYVNLDGDRYEIVQGHISQSERDTPKLVTARHYSADLAARHHGINLLGHAISLARAQELGLCINPPVAVEDGAGPVMTVAEGNNLVQKRAVGTVEVRWWTVYPPGVVLQLVVFEGTPDGPGISFGEEFGKKMRDYNHL